MRASALVPIFLASTVLFSPSALAYQRGDVTGAASVDPASVPVRSPARFTAEMCNTGTSNVAGTAFLGTYLPRGMGYRVVSPPTRGVCRAVLTGSYTYLYCTVSLSPGQCGDAVIDVTPTTAGTFTLYVLADSANVLRETNETDNRASVTLSAY